METVLRVVFVYILVWGCFRVLGKRELSQMAPFEFVMLLLIPQFFSRALTRQDYSMTNAVIAATTLFSLVFATSLTSFRFSGVRHLVGAEPSVLVRRGELVHDNMGRERISAEEIYAAMRKSGVERLQDVQWAILEGDGKISIVRAGS